MMESDYYKLLGIERGASKTDIKRAYYSQVKLYPPEKDPERFKAIRAAYEFLSDDSKRADYDKYADQPKKIAAAAQEAKRLIHNSQFKEAVQLLKKHQKNDILAALLVEAYIGNGNSGMAVNLAEDLIMRKPDDPEIHILLKDAYAARGFNNRAIETIEAALNKFPDNPAVLAEYIWAYHKIQDYIPPSAIDRLVPLADKVANYNHVILMLCLENDLMRDRDDRIPAFYSHYADGFLAAGNITPNQYENMVRITAEQIYKDDCRDTAERLAPFLLNHKFRNDQKVALDEIGNMVELNGLLEKKVLDGLLISYLMLLNDITHNGKPSGGYGANEKFMCEYSLVNEAENLRLSLFKLRDSYPKYFEMNKSFFIELMNPSMHKKLRSRYERERKERHADDHSDELDDLLEKLRTSFDKMSRKEQIKFMNDVANGSNGLGDLEDIIDNDYFDIFDEPEEDDEPEQPFVRTERKIGRNEPCPCGSGKKYKHCCGRAGSKAANQ